MTVPPYEPPFGGGGITPPPMPPPIPPTGGSSYGGQKNDTALYAMIAGILSLVCCGFIAGIAAIILGKQGMNKAELMGGEGEGQAKAGFIMGIISCALSGVTLVIYLLAFAVTAGTN